MKKVGRKYLAVDPTLGSTHLGLNLARITAPRIEVELVEIRRNPLRPTRRYLVRTEDGKEFATGVLEMVR